ncbi:MAG: TetR/AcrR family transcriptional regulator [Myxococcales bacterium]|nr:TetR/AcrR family transcriptional regulator [Myxococcales bacterium]
MPKNVRTPRVGKRLRTRDRLLVATQEWLLEKPASEISIREITDRAGVVHATFYNYYRTTSEAFEAVTLLLLQTYSHVIERTVADITDPAERVAASSRQTMHIVSSHPSVGKLLFDAGLSTPSLLDGIRARIGDDVRMGIDAGRFEVDDLDLIVSAAAALGLGVAMDLYEGRLSESSAAAVSVLILGILGVPTAEARSILARPLPAHEMPPLPLSLVEQTVQHGD